ncbi:hypothetical protein PBRA_006427 [Plasmodiophora brassicae]|uniref:Uncharacterized protein n=1 Tax=Plasmodiophora brassicae TaxID=37360 RepID=A0A0G4ISI4_PLABS|nr:hypothetical protein PBRA_006427 [Plasmodiophora brassicae]
MPPGPPVAVPIPDPTAQPAVPSRRRRTRYTTVEYAVANDAAEFHEHPVRSFSNVPICPNVVYVIVHAQRRRRRASSLQMPLVGRDGGHGLRRTGTSLARWATRATYLCNTEFIAMLATFKLNNRPRTELPDTDRGDLVWCGHLHLTGPFRFVSRRNNQLSVLWFMTYLMTSGYKLNGLGEASLLH